MDATIDLENPDTTFGLLLDEHSQTVTFGWLLNHGPRGDSSTERRASQRPFSSLLVWNQDSLDWPSILLAVPFQMGLVSTQ